MEALALIPLILLLAMVALRRPLIEGSVVFFLTTLVLAVYSWQMHAGAVTGSLVKGGFIAFDLALIVTGALLLMSLMKRSGLLTSLTAHIARISPDKRVQTITIAWLFGGFIEGVAGFGTPAAIVAPLLIGLGYAPVRAITIALIANSSAVAFGALGTPIIIGLSGADVAGLIGMMNLIGILIPLIILALITSDRASYLNALPFALYAGAAFLVPAMIASRFGPQYPSLIGAGVGLVLVVIAARYGWFMPRTEDKRSERPEHDVLTSIAPYLILIAVLIAQRFFPVVPIEIASITHNLPLANPGIAFFIASLTIRTPKRIADISTAGKPVVLILLLAASVQIMIASSQNALGLGSMTSAIASLTTALPLEITAPLLGAIGAFFAGSATVSNLLFAPVHLAAGGGALALAGQTLGASYANMLSLQNIVAVQATVGTQGLERSILSTTIIPASIMIIILVVISFLA